MLKQIVTITLVVICFLFKSPTSGAVDDADCNFEDLFLFDYEQVIWHEYSHLIESVICDVDDYWHQLEYEWLNYQSPTYVVQEYVDFPYVTPDSFPYRTPNGACNTWTDSPTVVAFYCLQQTGLVLREPLNFLDYLSWEANGYGELKIVRVLAHEWAHHVQQLMASSPTLQAYELQAECLTGVYLNYAVNNNSSTHVDLLTEDWAALQQAIPIDGPLDLMVSDTGVWSEISVFEQGSALRLGFEEGIDACLADF